MNELKVMADRDDSLEEPAGDEEALDQPKPLIEAVLALEPMQRASLGALIASSLANELVDPGTDRRGLLFH